MFSGRCGSRNYRISEEREGQSLTDVLVVFYLLLQSVPIYNSKGTKIFKEGGLGNPSFYRHCGLRMGCGGPHTYS